MISNAALSVHFVHVRALWIARNEHFLLLVRLIVGRGKWRKIKIGQKNAIFPSISHDHRQFLVEFQHSQPFKLDGILKKAISRLPLYLDLYTAGKFLRIPCSSVMRFSKPGAKHPGSTAINTWPRLAGAVEVPSSAHLRTLLAKLAADEMAVSISTAAQRP